MKGLQEKYGKDKFEVLMLSVDHGFGMPAEIAAKKDREKLASQGVDWQNVMLPNGFDDCHSKFNLDGYGLSLIGPDGIVRGIGIYPDTLAELLSESAK